MNALLRRSRFVLALLLGVVAVAWSFQKQWQHHEEKNVLRIAHTHGFPAVIAGFERIAREYEHAHPGVKIEQIVIPQRAYTAWLRTRLVGEVAPDVVELSGWMDNAADYARYYRDLTPELLAPNPYNRGNEFETTRWRDTFFTGIPEVPNYFQALLAYYSIPGSFISYRLIYNQPLLRQLGYENPPHTAIELAEMCAAISRHAREQGLALIPLATESENGRTLLEGVMRSATQETLLQIDPYGNYWNWDDDVAAAYLLGWWSLHTPAVHRGLVAMAQLGRQLPPGFMQIGKGEGTFLFLQGKAVFLLAPSYEYTMFRERSRFPIGIIRVPATVNADDPYNTEGNVLPIANLGIVKSGKQQDVALDFLRYFGSKEGNRLFTETGLWLPAIKGLVPRPEIAPFAPETKGRPPGLSLWLFGKADHFTLNQRLHELVGPNGSVDRFVDDLEGPYRESLKTVLAKRTELTRNVGQRLDTVLGAIDRLKSLGVDASTPQRNVAQILETQVISDSRAGYLELVLEQAAHPTEIRFTPLPARPAPFPPKP